MEYNGYFKNKTDAQLLADSKKEIYDEFDRPYKLTIEQVDAVAERYAFYKTIKEREKIDFKLFVMFCIWGIMMFVIGGFFVKFILN